jgi:two-component system cell cycle response regulator
VGGPPRDPVDKDGKRSSAWPEPDSTVRILATSVEAASLAVLRGARGSPPNEDDGFGELLPRSDTPETMVLSAIVRADRGTLTVIAGPSAGATLTLENGETILGRDPSCAVMVDDPSVSRRHARITRDERAHHFVEDLGSTNGTFVSGRRVRRAALCTGDRLQLGRDTIYRFAVVDREEEEFQRRLYEASMRDTLTELPNRRTLLERLAGEVAHAERTGGELGVLMIDIDHFKSINDKHGHLAGDDVLRAISHAGAEALRAGDVFARYGGEEFVVLARDADKGEATTLAERLRACIAGAQVEIGRVAVQVTVSIGVAVLSECERGEDGHPLLARADARLYRAKLSGRNRTVENG